MSFTDECEEVDMTEFDSKLPPKLQNQSKHQKFLSDTLSTNNCTFEGERQVTVTTNQLQTPKPQSKARVFDLPERLGSLKQITDNKVKFMKVEKELKELEECTFKPKTNPNEAKSSYKQFSRQPLDYKPRNPVLVKLRLQKLSQTTSVTRSTKANDTKVHDRLYKQAKQVTRPGTRC